MQFRHPMNADRHSGKERTTLRATLVFLAALAGCAVSLLASASAEQVRVYCAASLTTAVSALAESYENAGLGDVVLVTGASGALANQIVHGAPADVFLSANEDWVDFLIENQAIAEDAVTRFASNELVLVVPVDSELHVDPPTLEALAAALEGRRIVIGDPAVAPVGVYARQALTTLDLWPVVEPNIVFAQDATAALTYVSRGAVDAGIVYRTDAALTDVLTLATLPPASHDPITYYAAPVAQGNATAAAAFLTLITSDQGRTVLANSGFTLPATETETPIR